MGGTTPRALLLTGPPGEPDVASRSPVRAERADPVASEGDGPLTLPSPPSRGEREWELPPFAARGVSRSNRGRSLAPREPERGNGIKRTVEPDVASRSPVRAERADPVASDGDGPLALPSPYGGGREAGA
jgi:hypothetical protein